MASILNNVVSSASTTYRKRDKLLNILLQETAINLSAKVQQPVEDWKHHLMTYRNINLWFDTWDKDLVEIGFAYRDYEEKVIITDEQLQRIINLAESWFLWTVAKGYTKAERYSYYFVEAYHIL